MGWKFWLILSTMWIGWAVYQFVTGPKWPALIFDIVMFFVYVGLAVNAKKREKRAV